MKHYRKILVLFFGISLCMNSITQTMTEDSLQEIQKHRLSSRVGYNLFSYLSVDYERNLGSNVNLYALAGYKHGYRFNPVFVLLSCGSVYFNESRDKSGVMGGLGVSIKRQKEKSGYTTIYLEYRNTKVDRVIHDEGCHGGASDVGYSVHDFRSNELAIIFSLESRDLNKRKSRFYFSFGPAIGFAERKYSIEGTVNNQIESNRREKFNTTLLRIDSGIRF